MLLGQFIKFAGCVGVAIMRVEQLFGGGDDVDATLHQGVQGGQNFGQGRDGGHQGDVNVVVLLKIQEIPAHGDAEPLVETGDLTKVVPLLGRVDVKGGDNLPARFLEQ